MDTLPLPRDTPGQDTDNPIALPASEPTVETYPAKGGGTAVIIRGKDGKFLPGTQPARPITVASAPMMHQRRHEAAQRKIRAAMALAYNDTLANLPPDSVAHKLPPVTSGADAVAAGAAILYQDVVLDPGTRPDIRVDAWQTLGRAADVLRDPRTAGPDAGASQDWLEFLRGATVTLSVERKPDDVPSDVPD